MRYDNLHLKAPGNWINDPNGFIWYRGEYHLFYQYFPYEPKWGTMHWGHAVSKDLVHWEHKPIALYPSRYEDMNGCFSGSAVEKEGRLYIYYTGVRYEETSKEDIHHCLDEKFESAQLMITSEDGYYFDNFHDKKVMIPPVTDTVIGDRTHTRDPKVFESGGQHYMVVGSTNDKVQGKLLIYTSSDLETWDYLNSYTEDSGIFGWMCECPDIFEVDGQKILLFSSMGYLKDGMTEENQSLCTRISFNGETGAIQRQDDCWYIDYGLDIYACQTTEDESGRRIMIGWMRMPEAVEGSRPWIGMMSLPRVIEIRDGKICYPVHPAVKDVFEHAKEPAALSMKKDCAYQFDLELQEGEEISLGGYRIFRENGCIQTDRCKVYPEEEGLRTKFRTPEIDGRCSIEVYAEPNLIEIFVNDGEYVLSNVVYGLGSEIIIPDGITCRVREVNLL